LNLFINRTKKMKIVRIASPICALFLLALILTPYASKTIAQTNYWDNPGARLLSQPLSEYRARRQALMSQVTDGVVVILGNVEEDLGVEARYRQNNWMAYLTGVRTPGAALMLVPQGLPSLNGAHEIVFIPPRNLASERWTGPQIAPGEEAARSFGAERVLSMSEDFWPKLREAAALPAFKGEQTGQTRMKLYTIVPRRIANGDVNEFQFVEQARNELPGVEVLSVAPIVGEMRKKKSAVEIALIQKAIDITGEAQSDIARNLKPGMYEYEVQAILEAAFTRGGAERPSFPSIVGSGIYSTILHYEENHKKIEPGDLVVCDIGAEYSLYAADITRTYPASGKFTERQRQIYQLVLDTQAGAAAYYKPGMRLHDLHQFAVDFLRKSPLRARDTDGREYTMDHFFIHALGHYLGMDVHDTGNSSKPLQPGEVFTIEPGVYLQK